MTARTYTNAEIVWPNGERTKVPSVRIEFRDEAPRDAPRPLAFSGKMLFTMADQARLGAEAVAELSALFKRLAAPRICWKCHDGRTRAHNRRCRYRGHGRNAETSDA